MLVEILGSTFFGGILIFSEIYKRGGGNDHRKIQVIAKNCGLVSKEGKEIRIHRKSKNPHYTEYVYQLPLGLSSKQFQDKIHYFQDGLNAKKMFNLSLDDFKELRFNKRLFKQLEEIFAKKPVKKQIEIEYDGMLKVLVYNSSLPDMVPFTDETLERLSGWKVAIGEARGEFVTHDFDRMQMLIVAGMTRYGKTVFIKNAITTLINNQPDNVKFTLIDLKGGLAFSRFANCRQVHTVAKNGEETLQALEAIHTELLERQALFLANGWEDIGEAGWKERHFVIVDEGAEIAGFPDKQTRERCAHLLGEIARIGAGLGYRLIFGTQYPTADVFPRQVKANTSAALCFKLKNSTQSMVVLDRGGAEALPVGLPGRAIYQTDRDRIVQAPFIKNDFIDNKIAPHIVIRPRKENEDEKHDQAAEKGRGNTVIVEETELLD